MKPFSRREILSLLPASVAASLMHSTADAQSGACFVPDKSGNFSSTAQPDILFICVDDLNDWVSPMDRPANKFGPNYKPLPDNEIVTPNIQDLATNGVVFQNAFADAVACAPSRNAVLAGLAPYHSGFFDLDDDDYFLKHPNELCNSLPALLKRANAPMSYRTLGFGKIFHTTQNLAISPPGTSPSVFLWDKFENPSESDTFGTPFTHLTDGLGVVSGIPAAQNPQTQLRLFPKIEAPSSVDGKIADAAIAAIMQERVLPDPLLPPPDPPEPPIQPMFCAVGFRKPHLPWVVPAEDFHEYMAKNIVVPDVSAATQNGMTLSHCVASRTKAGPNEPSDNIDVNLKRSIAAYLAGVTHMDRQLGAVVTAFKQQAAKRGKSFVIIFWSDHGFALGKRRAWRKFRFYSNVTRIPLIIQDSQIPTTFVQSNRSQIVALRDLYLTVLKYANLDRPHFLSRIALESRPDLGSGVASLRQLVTSNAAWARDTHICTYSYGEFLSRAMLATESAHFNECANLVQPSTIDGNYGKPMLNNCGTVTAPEACMDPGLTGAAFSIRKRDPDGHEWLYVYMRHDSIGRTRALFERVRGTTTVNRNHAADLVPNEELYLVDAPALSPWIMYLSLDETRNLIREAAPANASFLAKANSLRDELRNRLFPMHVNR